MAFNIHEYEYKTSLTQNNKVAKFKTTHWGRYKIIQMHEAHLKG